MKKGIKILIIVAIILLVLIIGLIPIPRWLKDGGTVEYNAIFYSVHHVNSLADGGYNMGTKVRVLFWTVFNDVHFVGNRYEDQAVVEPVAEPVVDNNVVDNNVVKESNSVLLHIGMQPGGEMTRQNQKRSISAPFF